VCGAEAVAVSFCMMSLLREVSRDWFLGKSPRDGQMWRSHAGVPRDERRSGALGVKYRPECSGVL